MSEFSERIGMEAGNNFKKGFNCCEAIVETFRKEAGVDINDNAFRLCSGFGGGIGHAANICGALVGCTMVISTLAGRNHPAEKPLGEIYPLSKEFHDRFEKEFGSTMCKDLMPYEFDTRDHLKNCLKLTNRIAQLLAVYLEKKGLIKA